MGRVQLSEGQMKIDYRITREY